jgi:hypothetical protein
MHSLAISPWFGRRTLVTESSTVPARQDPTHHTPQMASSCRETPLLTARHPPCNRRAADVPKTDGASCSGGVLVALLACLRLDSPLGLTRGDGALSAAAEQLIICVRIMQRDLKLLRSVCKPLVGLPILFFRPSPLQLWLARCPLV